MMFMYVIQVPTLTPKLRWVQAVAAQYADQSHPVDNMVPVGTWQCQLRNSAGITNQVKMAARGGISGMEMASNKVVYFDKLHKIT